MSVNMCNRCFRCFEIIETNWQPDICRACKEAGFFDMLSRETHAEIKREHAASERKAKYRKQATGSPVSRTRTVK